MQWHYLSLSIKCFVINCDESLILRLHDDAVHKLIKHTKKEGTPNIKDANQIKYYRFLFFFTF